ncbi:MAG: repair protein RecO protein, partial [Candidatus Gottesmanbacteria bacterium GW2011_GWC2_39_8]
MRTYKTEGIILRRINFGEADRLITIFSKHYGKQKVLGKGVRKIKSRRAPHLELFNRSVIFLHRGKNFDIITEAQTINSFSDLRKDL